MKDSAFENTLLKSLSWFLHSYLGLKAERGRRKMTLKFEQQKFFFQVKEKRLFSTKSSLELSCTIFAKEAVFENTGLLLNRANKVCTQELGCVYCFHRVTIPISSPSSQSPRAPVHHPRWQKWEWILSSPLCVVITTSAKFLIKKLTLIPRNVDCFLFISTFRSDLFTRTAPNISQEVSGSYSIKNTR